MSDTLRVDVVLHRLRLTRSRSEAKAACEVGAVFIGERVARPSDSVRPGDRITVRFPRRLLEVELLTIPGKSLSRQAAREVYRAVRDEESDGVE